MQTTVLLVAHSKDHAHILVNGYFRSIQNSMNMSLHLEGILEIITDYFFKSMDDTDTNTTNTRPNTGSVALKFKPL